MTILNSYFEIQCLLIFYPLFIPLIVSLLLHIIWKFSLSSDFFLCDTLSFFTYVHASFVYRKIAYVWHSWKFVLNILILCFFSCMFWRLGRNEKRHLEFIALGVKISFSPSLNLFTLSLVFFTFKTISSWSYIP